MSFSLLNIWLCVLLIFKEFARRALGKIENLAKWERENDVPASLQTQSAFREASIKAGIYLAVSSFTVVFPPFAFSFYVFFGFNLVKPFFSIYQLAAVLFKRLVFENGKRSKAIFKPKSKGAVKKPPNVTPLHLLMG